MSTTESAGHTVPGLQCSARGCRSGAVWALRWNNPKLHSPQRRKTWLACEDHREHLGDFLSLRGFLREVVPADSLDDNGSLDNNGER